MVFANTAVAPAGKLTNVSEISPGIFCGAGTWVATAVTEGEIVTGLDHIVFGIFLCGNGSVFTQMMNQTQNGSAEQGTMGLLLCTSGAGGQYFFMGYNDAHAFI